jgi:hypothetical protein
VDTAASKGVTSWAAIAKVGKARKPVVTTLWRLDGARAGGGYVCEKESTV